MIGDEPKVRQMMQKYIHLEETDSTNKYLSKLLLEQNLDEGMVVYTDFQTAGKGQRGNSWESEREKNITFSIVLYPNTIPANQQFIISQFTSLAIKDVLDKYTNDISIKWPNDIYWKDKKIGGILIENSLYGSNIGQSILGIGINVNQEIFTSDAPNPISLKEITGKEYNKMYILHEITDLIMSRYEGVKSNKSELIISNYKSSLFRRDGYHLFNDGKKDFRAKIKDVDNRGTLLLETDSGITREFAFKEVKYII